MSPRPKRFKILLDEMFPRRIKYPALNRHHDVKHIVHDYQKGGITDVRLLELARKDNRIVITKNIKDFQFQCQPYRVDVIGVTETIPPEELDKSIMAKLRSWGKPKMSGRFTKIIKPPRKYLK